MSQNTTKELALAEIRRKSDKIMVGSLLAMFIFGIAISFVYDTWLIGFAIGGANIAAFLVARYGLPKHTLYEYVGSAAYAIFMAQFIYQMHGLFEMHFFAFVGSVLLITYQNWKNLIPLVLIVVLHHALFAYLQYSGNEEVYFTQLAYMDLPTFIIHIGLAALIFGLCMYWAYTFNGQTLQAISYIMRVEKQLKQVKQNVEFAEAISQGNLDHTFDSGQDNELGKALVKMRDNLKIAARREDNERFVSQGSSQIERLMRAHSNDLDGLGDHLISTIVKHLGANQGGLYLVKNEALYLHACYAYNRKKYIDQAIQPGEGLLGQAYLEKDMILLTEIPQEYVRITSGLGDANPNCILIMPLMAQEQVVGMLEVASFKVFEEKEIEFIKEASESIATTILSAQVNERTKELLADAEQQKETLQEQEENMRQNMEELYATQETLSRKTKEYEAQLAERDRRIEELMKEKEAVS